MNIRLAFAAIALLASPVNAKDSHDSFASEDGYTFEHKQFEHLDIAFNVIEHATDKDLIADYTARTGKVLTGMAAVRAYSTVSAHSCTINAVTRQSATHAFRLVIVEYASRKALADAVGRSTLVSSDLVGNVLTLRLIDQSVTYTPDEVGYELVKYIGNTTGDKRVAKLVGHEAIHCIYGEFHGSQNVT